MNRALPAEGSLLWGCLSGSQVISDIRKRAGTYLKGGITCVLTPKSHSFTWPRVFTSILDGFTSVGETKVYSLDYGIMYTGMVTDISMMDFNRKYFRYISNAASGL